MLDPKMVLRAFRGSLGLIVEARGGSLPGFGGASRSATEGFQIPLETLLGLVCSLLAASFSFMFVILSSMSSFIFFRGLLGSMLSSEADPTLKNLHFPEGKQAFSKKRSFASEDVLRPLEGASGSGYTDLASTQKNLVTSKAS